MSPADHMLDAIYKSAVSSRVDRHRFAIILLLACGLAGMAIRWLYLPHVGQDAVEFLLPWYAFARDNGIGALRTAFTNYTPFYSYLLLLAAWFDGFAQPLTLIKAISFCFELGCALVTAHMVWQSTKSPTRAALAFAGVWLAPTALLNGAAWGQADAIWTFFILLSLSLFMRHRNGTLPFAAAVAVKAQGVFLGPLVFGLILRRRLHWAWMLVIPVVYILFAVPTLLAGRTLPSVLGVYLGQAETYHHLSMNAANLWVFASGVPYAVGVPAGLVIAALAGGAVSLLVARSQREDPEFVLLAACVSLFLMPYLLPKMHDRYFYAFEIASIALVCINPRYLAFAAVAQIDGVLSYIAFDPGVKGSVPVAALCNTLLGCYLIRDLWSGERSRRHTTIGTWLGFAAAGGLLLSYLLIADPASNVFIAKMLMILFVAMTFLLLSGTRRAPPYLPSRTSARRQPDILDPSEKSPYQPGSPLGICPVGDAPVVAPSVACRLHPEQ